MNFIFPYIENFIIPTDEVIFCGGVAQPPTSIPLTIPLMDIDPPNRRFSRLLSKINMETQGLFSGDGIPFMVPNINPIYIHLSAVAIYPIYPIYPIYHP